MKKRLEAYDNIKDYTPIFKSIIYNVCNGLTIPQIVKHTRIKEKTVSGRLSELERDGYISKVYDSSIKHSIYTHNKPKDFKKKSIEWHEMRIEQIETTLKKYKKELKDLRAE